MPDPLQKHFSISEMKDGKKRWMVRLLGSGKNRWAQRCSTREEAEKLGRAKALEHLNGQHRALKEITTEDVVALNQIKAIQHQLHDEFKGRNPLANHNTPIKLDKLAEYGEQLIRLAAPMIQDSKHHTLHDAVNVMDAAIKKRLEVGKVPTFNEIKDKFLTR